MERRMKQKKYGILMVVGIVAMVLIPFAPCMAWDYEYSQVASGPLSGSDDDTGTGYTWNWWFTITGITTGADSTGAWASANCSNGAYVQIYAATSDLSKSPCVACTSWGLSHYSNDDPNIPLTIRWSIEGEGTVEVYGSVGGYMLGQGDTMTSYAQAIGAVKGSQGGYGTGVANGSVSRNGNGSASVHVYGHAVEDDSDIGNGLFEQYYADLEFSVNASGTEPDYHGTSYDAKAEVSAASTTLASVTVSQGNATVETSSMAQCIGSVRNWISW